MCGGCDRRPEEDGMGVDYEAEDWEEQAEQAKRVEALEGVLALKPGEYRRYWCNDGNHHRESFEWFRREVHNRKIPISVRNGWDYVLLKRNLLRSWSKE